MTNQQDTALLPVTEADAIAFCERALRNVEYLRLSRDDLEDIRGALQSFVQKRFAEQAKPSDAGEVERLREAIKPFADCCEFITDDEDDEEWAKFRLLIKDYRRARTAMASLPSNSDGDSLRAGNT